MFQKLSDLVGFGREPRNHRELVALIEALRPLSGERGLIRVGPKGDGGYLVPDDLEGLGGSISPGVSTECGFDLEVAQRGIAVHMADASVDTPPVQHPLFNFSKLYLDTYSSTDSVRIDEYCSDIAPGCDLILQMDIEGAEYRVLNSASDELLRRFRIIIVEFHDLQALFTHFGFREISSVLLRILRTHAVVQSLTQKVVALGEVA